MSAVPLVEFPVEEVPDTEFATKRPDGQVKDQGDDLPF